MSILSKLVPVIAVLKVFPIKQRPTVRWINQNSQLLGCNLLKAWKKRCVPDAKLLLILLHVGWKTGADLSSTNFPKKLLFLCVFCTFHIRPSRLIRIFLEFRNVYGITTFAIGIVDQFMIIAQLDCCPDILSYSPTHLALTNHIVSKFIRRQIVLHWVEQLTKHFTVVKYITCLKFHDFFRLTSGVWPHKGRMKFPSSVRSSQRNCCVM